MSNVEEACPGSHSWTVEELRCKLRCCLHPCSLLGSHVRQGQVSQEEGGGMYALRVLLGSLVDLPGSHSC